MPPNEKQQLSSAEIALVKSWIDDGAAFDKAVKDYPDEAKIMGYLNSIFSQSIVTALIPVEEVAAADARTVGALTDKGVLVVPVGSGSNYLSVSFTNARQATDKDLELLVPIKEQLLWLNIGRTQISDAGLKTIGQLSKLTKLNLEYTAIGDVGLENLLSLTKLTSLNLVGTKAGDAGLVRLSQLSQLKKIFVYQTGITAKGVSEALAKSPELKVDTGHYLLPTLITDTLVFKSKR